MPQQPQRSTMDYDTLARKVVEYGSERFTMGRMNTIYGVAYRQAEETATMLLHEILVEIHRLYRDRGDD